MARMKRRNKDRIEKKIANRLRRAAVFIPCDYEEIDEETHIDTHYFKKPIKGKLLKKYCRMRDMIAMKAAPYYMGYIRTDHDDVTFLFMLSDYSIPGVYDFIDVTNTKGKTMKQIVSE